VKLPAAAIAAAFACGIALGLYSLLVAATTRQAFLVRGLAAAAWAITAPRIRQRPIFSQQSDRKWLSIPPANRILTVSQARRCSGRPASASSARIATVLCESQSMARNWK